MPGVSARINGRKGGRPKGSKAPETFKKEIIRAKLRAMVEANAEPMIEAQIALAKGVKYLVTRDKLGKFVKVTEAMAGALQGDEIIEVWEDKGSTPAFTDLMNRAIDKPVDSVNVDHSGGIDISWKAAK